MLSKYLLKIPADTNKLLGSKGEKLNFLSLKNFTLPLTYCLTEEAYTFFIKANNLLSELTLIYRNKKLSSAEKENNIQSLFREAVIPGEIIDEIYIFNLDDNNAKKWAVRSSSNMEDMSKASFAGLYDSYLNVYGFENIQDSIKKCWASLWNERAIIYRDKNKLCHEKGKMAVIIQEMVESIYSGVIFTQHPASVDKDEILIEYCEGLGEALVSGKIIPYSCVFYRATQNIRYIVEPGTKALSDKDIIKLSMIALEVENCCGCPQDIEWAFDGKEYFLLQTRPITQTASGFKVDIDNIWTRANIGEVLPDVITPLTWDIFRCTLFNKTLPVMKTSIQDYSIFDNAICLINGRGYLKLKFFLDSFCYLPYATPEVMKKVLGVDIVSENSSYKQPNGMSVKAAQLLFILDTFKIFPRISLLLNRLSDIPSRETKNLEKIIQWNARCFYLHIKCTSYSIGAFSLLSHYLRKWIPSNAEGLISLILTGNENMQTAEQGICIWEISNFVRSKPELIDIIKNESEWTKLLGTLYEVDGGTEFLGMIQNFLKNNGARAAEEFELAVPRWREKPDFIIDVMRSYINIPLNESNAKDITVRRRNRDKAVEDTLRALSTMKGIIFKKILSSYARFCTLRENIKYLLMEGYFNIRMMLLDIGDQLVFKGILNNKNDIFFLRLTEISDVLKDKRCYNKFKELISERKDQYEKNKNQTAAALVYKDGSPFQTINESTSSLKGIGCSPGIIKGYARVLNDISEMNDLRYGEILVTTHTDPGWTPLFLNCKGLITETGGFLSHGATVAREYGIPAVVNVSKATLKIQTGDYLFVDGNSGVVVINDVRWKINDQ